MPDAVVAGAIFLVSLAVIMSERVERTIAAVSGAATMVAAGLLLGFYTEDKALEAIDFNKWIAAGFCPDRRVKALPENKCYLSPDQGPYDLLLL